MAERQNEATTQARPLQRDGYTARLEKETTEYGRKRLLNGETVSFGSDGLPHELRFEKSTGEYVVYTGYSMCRIPKQVAMYMAAHLHESGAV